MVLNDALWVFSGGFSLGSFLSSRVVIPGALASIRSNNHWLWSRCRGDGQLYQAKPHHR